MKICGLIVEYNPMTNGHLYHLNKAKELTNADIYVCVMSGHFTQRGEPTIIDKWQRTQLAIDAGIDLVIELPFVFGCESQDYFSKGAISILKAIGCDVIVFGAESYTKEGLETLVQESQSDDYKQRLKTYLSQGYSYPKSCSMAFNTNPIKNPNDLLGFAYIKEIQRQQAPIDYFIIKRDNNYHDFNLKTSSATSIRKAMLEGKAIHAYSPTTFTGHLHHIEDYYPYLTQKLLLEDITRFKSLHLITEGIEYRLRKYILEASTMDEFLQSVCTKRYSRPRILRVITHLLLDDESGPRDTMEVCYIRILGYSKNGQAFLNQLKKTCPLPIVTQLSKFKHPHLLLELKATYLYTLPLSNKERNALILKEKYGIPYTKGR